MPRKSLNSCTESGKKDTKCFSQWFVFKRVSFIYVFILWTFICKGSPGGHLYLKLDIILVKKIHIIMVVFLGPGKFTHVHHLGVQKHAKLEKNGVFLVILTNFKNDITYKYLKNMFMVWFESLFMRMISSPAPLPWEDHIPSYSS